MNKINSSSTQVKKTDKKSQSEPNSPPFHVKPDQELLQICNQFRQLIFSSILDINKLKQHLLITYKGIKYIMECLNMPDDKYYAAHSIVLPEKNCHQKKTLFLDLDETLIHHFRTDQDQYRNEDKLQKEGLQNNKSQHFSIKLRPYCRQFLQEVSNYYEIFIFTASSQDYAEKIINFIDSKGELIDGIISRKHCLQTKNGLMIKDLKIVRNRNLKDMILVDNFSYSFGSQINNGVPILAWHIDPNDSELKYLSKYLIEASKSEDVRVYNQEKLKLQELYRINQDFGKQLPYSPTYEKIAQ